MSQGPSVFTGPSKTTSQAKQLLLYYKIPSKASWTERDLSDHVFFWMFVWNILWHSVKMDPLWIHWWVFKYTQGRMALSRKKSKVSFPSEVTVVVRTATCFCPFSPPAGQQCCSSQARSRSAEHVHLRVGQIEAMQRCVMDSMSAEPMIAVIALLIKPCQTGPGFCYD